MEWTAISQYGRRHRTNSPCSPYVGKPHILHTHTQCAFFRVIDLEEDDYMHLVDKQGNHVGLLNLCQDVSAFCPVGREVEVMVISEIMQDNIDNVLCIEREDGVATRRGIGTMRKDQWAAQSWKETEVLLA